MNGYDGIKPTALRAYPFAPAGAARRLFPPKYDQAEDAQHAWLSVVRRAPDLFSHRQSRWTLATLMQSFPGCGCTPPAACGRCSIAWIFDTNGRAAMSIVPIRIMRRKSPTWKRPGPRLRPSRNRSSSSIKMNAIIIDNPLWPRPIALKARTSPWPHAGYGSNPRCGLLGGLNALTGQTTYAQHRRIGIDQLVAFYRTLAPVYAPAQQIFIVQDNLPLHFHPNVLVHLQPQQWPWPPAVPDNWPTQPTVQPTAPALPIRLLLLPTYASWLNPIEKLWRWLKQTLLHMHGFGHDVKQLEQHVADFLDQFLDGSTDLLRYTGLLHD